MVVFEFLEVVLSLDRWKNSIETVENAFKIGTFTKNTFENLFYSRISST